MTFRTPTRWYGKLFNKRVAGRLQSSNPGALSKNHLLITFEGRKSGKHYTIPVNYRHTAEGTIVVSTEARWWRNLEGGADVNLVLAGESVSGHAVPITDDPDKRERYGRSLTGFTWRWFARSLVIIEIVLH